MLIVTCKSFMLNIIMLNVVMLSAVMLGVVVPFFGQLIFGLCSHKTLLNMFF